MKYIKYAVITAALLTLQISAGQDGTKKTTKPEGLNAAKPPEKAPAKGPEVGKLPPVTPPAKGPEPVKPGAPKPAGEPKKP